MKKESKFLSVKQVAEYLEVSKQAVDKWINAGEMKVYRLPSGRIKILKSDFLDYIKTHNLYLDEEFFNIQSKKIVVIDDDEMIHMLLKKFFDQLKADVEVDYANDGMSGLIKIGASSADIVILDIEMPEMSGIEVCKKILEDSSLSGITIIAVSGYLSKYEEELKELGIKITIEKPFKLKELEKQLLSII